MQDNDVILGEEVISEDNNIISIGKRRLVIHADAYRKMFYYTNATHSEISGLGKVKITDSDIIVTDVLLFKQTCTRGGTSLNAEMLARWLVALVQKRKSPKHYKLWWHSHNDFGVFWSHTDETTIKELSENSELVSICINKSGDMVGRIDTDGITEDLQVVVLPVRCCGMQKKCQAEVKQKVSKEVIGIVKFPKTSGFDKDAPPIKNRDNIDWNRVYREFFRTHSRKNGHKKFGSL